MPPCVRPGADKPKTAQYRPSRWEPACMSRRLIGWPRASLAQRGSLLRVANSDLPGSDPAGAELPRPHGRHRGEGRCGFRIPDRRSSAVVVQAPELKAAHPRRGVRPARLGTCLCTSPKRARWRPEPIAIRLLARAAIAIRLLAKAAVAIRLLAKAACWRMRILGMVGSSSDGTRSPRAGVCRSRRGSLEA